MKKMWIPLMALMVLAALTGCGSKEESRSASPEIRSLVDGVMAEYGGEEAMRGIKGYRA